MNSTMHPVPQWQAPWEAEQLFRALTALRRTDPRVPDAVFDDLNRVMEEHTPPADVVDSLVDRLCSALVHLVSVAMDADPAAVDHPLVARARELTSAPTGAAHALGRLRRLAWATHDLLESLVDANHVRITD